jgi:hypothetical protein
MNETVPAAPPLAGASAAGAAGLVGAGASEPVLAGTVGATVAAGGCPHAAITAPASAEAQ